MLKTRVITAIAALAIIAVVLVVLPRLWAEVVIGLLLLVGQRGHQRRLSRAALTRAY